MGRTAGGWLGSHILLFLLIGANLIGFAMGMVVYQQQMAAVSPIFWIFIPDCPLYILLATLFYLGIFREDVFGIIIASGLVKYGLWTLFALMYYSGHFLSNWFGWLLFVEHIGMTLQFVLVGKAYDIKLVLIAAGWFLLNDFVDYALGMHPYLPGSDFGAVAAFAVASSLLAPPFIYYAGRKLEKNRLVGALRELVLV